MSARKKVSIASPAKAPAKTPAKAPAKKQTENPCTMDAIMKKLIGMEKILRNQEEEILDMSSKIDILIELYEEEGEEKEEEDDNEDSNEEEEEEEDGDIEDEK